MIDAVKFLALRMASQNCDARVIYFREHFKNSDSTSSIADEATSSGKSCVQNVGESWSGKKNMRKL